MHRRALLASLTLLGVAACSSGDDTAGEPSIPSEVTNEDLGVASDPSEEPAGSEQLDPLDAIDDPGGSDAEFCAAISAIQSAEFELEETFGTEARTLFDDVQAAAPVRIAGDVATVVAALDAMAEIGISADDDDPVAVDAAFEILLDPDFIDANENLEAYTSEACGIDLGAGAETDIDLSDLEQLDG